MSRVYRPPVFDAAVDLDLSRNEGRPTVTGIDLDPDDLARFTARYPDSSDLAEVVARRHRVPMGQVLITAGGDDALLRCFLATAGSPAVATRPSFEMISRYAAQVGTTLREVPWWDGEFPIAAFLREADSGPGVAVIVSPNNPTGNVVDHADLRKVADVYPLVVLDAAYAEFADDDLTPTALELDNVVVIRTLSKAFGLAGLRVGYLLGAEDVIGDLAGYGSPYPVSGLSSAIAVRALRDGLGKAETHPGEIASGRRRLTELLHELGCAPLSSQANFVLARDVTPDWLVPAAASLGVGLRRFPDNPDLARCVRITVPPDGAVWPRLEGLLRSVLAPEAILFDMDGVLVDVTDSYRAAIVATAATFGVDVSHADIAAAKAGGNASDDWELTRRLCAAADIDVAYDEVRDRFETIYQGDGAKEGLKLRERLLVDVSRVEAWSRRLPLGIVTARPRRDAEESLQRFGIDGFFATVVTREDARAKPDPAPVRLALDRLGVERAWMVGDTVDDLEAARACGVVPIGVAATGEARGALSGSPRILSSVNELEEVLDVTQR